MGFFFLYKLYSNSLIQYISHQSNPLSLLMMYLNSVYHLHFKCHKMLHFSLNLQKSDVLQLDTGPASLTASLLRNHTESIAVLFLLFQQVVSSRSLPGISAVRPEIWLTLLLTVSIACLLSLVCLLVLKKGIIWIQKCKKKCQLTHLKQINFC